MSYILHKCSSPGGEWRVNTIEEATAELRKHICRGCMLGNEETQTPAPDPNNIDDLLSTPCGCEYDLEETA